MTYNDQDKNSSPEAQLKADNRATGSVPEAFTQMLGHISGGKVLDVATGSGNFINILKGSLQEYEAFTGIDVRPLPDLPSPNVFEEENVHHLVMDAGNLDFEEGHFDTLNMGFSLNHLDDIPKVLAETKRALKPGGVYILCEMHQGRQTEAQHTQAAIHGWAASMDRALGITHHPVFTRQKILEIAQGLNLREQKVWDYVNLDSDPLDPEAVEHYASAIDRHLQRAEGLPNYDKIKQRGEEIRQRIHQYGCQMEPLVVITGLK